MRPRNSALVVIGATAVPDVRGAIHAVPKGSPSFPADLRGRPPAICEGSHLGLDDHHLARRRLQAKFEQRLVGLGIEKGVGQGRRWKPH